MRYFSVAAATPTYGLRNSLLAALLLLAAASLAIVTQPTTSKAQETSPPTPRPKIPASALLPIPAGAPSQRFGVITHLPRLNVGWTPDLLPMIRALGVGSFHESVEWRLIETKKGVYAMPPLVEEMVDRGNALGLEPVILLGYDNPLYQNNLDKEAFTRHALWIIDHFKGRVKTFELFSEPEIHRFPEVYGGTWNGKEADNGDSPWIKKLAETVAYAAGEIKKKHPEVKLIGSAVIMPGTQRLFKYPAMWKNLDALTIHPYPYHSPPEIVPWGGKELDARDGVKVSDEDQSFSSMLRLLREGLQRAGRPDLPIWITEVGYSTAQVKKVGLWQGYTEFAQAAFNARLGIMAAGNGVARTYFYDFYDDGDDPHEIEFHFGLVRHDYSPKPSFFALQRLCALLPGDSKAVAPKTEVERLDPWRPDDGAQTYSFQRPDGTRVVFLWQSGRIYGDVQEELANLTIQLPNVAVSEIGRVVSGEKLSPKVSRDGNVLKISELPFGADPVYVVLK